MYSSEKNKIVNILLWVSITMFYCYQYILRTLPNIVMGDIMSKYNIGASDFGSFAGVYYIGYVTVPIPIGILLMRFGPKFILPLFIASTALGAAPIVYSDCWNSVIIGRIFTGIGSSAAAVGALQIFRMVYPDKFTRLLGLTVFCGLITSVYAAKPLSYIIENIGLNATIEVLVYSGAGLAILTYILMPNFSKLQENNNIWVNIKTVMLNPRIIIASLCAGLMVGPVEGFADAWGSAFMVAVYDLDKATADHFSMSIYIGMAIGCIILPYIADKTRLHIGITIFSGISMILCFVYILSGNAIANSLYYTCIVTGIFCAYQIIILSKITTFVAEQSSGFAGAIANMILMGFGWFFHNSIGNSLEKLWDGTEKNGAKIYGGQAFIDSISIIPITTAVGIAGLLLLVIYEVIRANGFKKSSKIIS